MFHTHLKSLFKTSLKIFPNLSNEIKSLTNRALSQRWQNSGHEKEANVTPSICLMISGANIIRHHHSPTMQIMYNAYSKTKNQRFQNINFLKIQSSDFRFIIYAHCMRKCQLLTEDIFNNTNLLALAEPSIKRAVSDLRSLILL
jgi:hypothetical protein